MGAQRIDTLGVGMKRRQSTAVVKDTPQEEENTENTVYPLEAQDEPRWCQSSIGGK
jgi:hypothetical protein